MAEPTYFPHHLLIAMPQQQQDAFEHSLVYLYQHNAHGASGIIINQPTGSNIGDVLQQLNINATGTQAVNRPVLYGGPVNPENGFIIYPNKLHKKKNPQYKDHDPLTLTASFQVLEKIAQGNDPKEFIITLGYSSWDAGQLEEELQGFSWLIAPYRKKILFNTPINKRREQALRLTGLEINQLSTEIGHA